MIIEVSARETVPQSSNPHEQWRYGTFCETMEYKGIRMNQISVHLIAYLDCKGGIKEYSN